MNFLCQNRICFLGTDSEIRFIFPAGLSSGRLYLEDNGVRSNSLFYEVDEKIARWDVASPTFHSFRSSFVLERFSVEGDESFHFWMPQPSQEISFREEGTGTSQLISYTLEGWKVYTISASKSPFITLEETYEVKVPRISVVLNPDLVEPLKKDSTIAQAYQTSSLFMDGLSQS